MDNLAEIEAEIAALEAARAEREAAAEERRTAEAAKARLQGLKALADAEAEHGMVGERLCTVEHEGAIVAILKKPNAGEYRRFQDSKARSEDAERFVTRCRVWPDKGAFGALLRAFPGLLVPATRALCALTGQKDGLEGN